MKFVAESTTLLVMEDMSSMRNVVCIERRVRVCKTLSEAAKTLTTRDHVRGISGPPTLLNNWISRLRAISNK
jgi:hypothetical protein